MPEAASVLIGLAEIALTRIVKALSRFSTPYAPWHVVQANLKWYRNLAIARTVADTLEAMDPQFPEPKAGIAGLTVE